MMQVDPKHVKMIRVAIGVLVVGLGVYFQSWWGLIGLIPIIAAISEKGTFQDHRRAMQDVAQTNKTIEVKVEDEKKDNI